MQAYSSGQFRVRIGGCALPANSRERQRDAAADDATVNAVLAALDDGDLEGSAGRAAEALKSGLEHPVLRCVMAMSLQAARQFDEAVPHLRRAIALRPTDVSIANALARCLLDLERPLEALSVLEAALKLEPRHAETHANRGRALELRGQFAAAERNYIAALELQPDQLIAKAGMATLSSHYGDHDAATAHARVVLEAAPDHANAVIVLAVAELARGMAASAEARIRRLMAEPRPDPLLASYLGDALDAQGRAEEAFEAWTRSGEALRRVHASRFPGEGVLAAAERTAGFLERLSADRWPSGHANPPTPAGVETHVFLLGFARSGTSLLGLALAGHEQVEILDEQEPLTDSLNAFAGADGMSRLLSATEAELEVLRNAYWRRVRAAGAKLERKVFVDKQPMNSLYLPLIARLFPGARILFARRDPRDVALSCFRRRFLMNRYTYEFLSIEGAARLYAAAARLRCRMGELASLNTLVVAHEDLVEDFDGEMRRVCKFLGLASSDALRTFAGRVRSGEVATPSASQLARGLNSDGVGQWRRYERQLQPLMPILEPWVKRFGYDRLPVDDGPDWDVRTSLRRPGASQVRSVARTG